MRNRTIITNVEPKLHEASYAIKRTPGEQVKATADIFADGDNVVKAHLLFKESTTRQWLRSPMTHLGHDRWEGSFTVDNVGWFDFKIEAWIDKLATWHSLVMQRLLKGSDVSHDLKTGALLLMEAAKSAPAEWKSQFTEWGKKLAKPDQYSDTVELISSVQFSCAVEEYYFPYFPTTFDKTPRIRVGRKKELFSTWYQMFPRSASEISGQHGTFKDCERVLPRIAEMGFDVLLFPPIHPIGLINRKGKNNAPNAEPGDVGSPWAVGNSGGGHNSIHPALGDFDDFSRLLNNAASHGIEIAFDLNFRCSPNHPCVKEHPDWFLSPSGGVPADEVTPSMIPDDVIDFNFECEDWKNLWEELKDTVLFWAEKGIRIFFASTPHHQPFAFWQWLIGEVQIVYPETIFLSGAFIRPKPMLELAKTGFTQSFTYFIWQIDKNALQTHLTQLIDAEWRYYLRPNFFANTPDILPHNLRDAGISAFMLRYALAAVLSSNCGIYGPAFELCVNQGKQDGTEQYLDSEKYELKTYDWNARNRLTDFIAQINQIRREHTALQQTCHLFFTNTDNDQLMSFVKIANDGTLLWIVANLDPINKQSGYIEVPKDLLGITGRYLNLKVRELLSGETYHWFNEWNYVELIPDRFPLHILQVIT